MNTFAEHISENGFLNQDQDRPEKKPTETPPNQPEKHIPAKPDINPDPTKPTPGGNEPEKVDPTRIDEPEKVDPTRIEHPEELNGREKDDYFPVVFSF
jgi:hypothetical protein